VFVIAASGDLATAPQSRTAAHGEATQVDASPSPVDVLYEFPASFELTRLTRAV